MKDERFDNKTITFATAIGDVYKDEQERGNYPKLELKEDELTEDFTAMLWAQKTLYTRITGEDVDIFEFISILNRLAIQRIGEIWRQEWEEEQAGGRQESHANPENERRP